MTFLVCHLKSLIFDCISFTEGLITLLSQQTVRPLPPLEPLSHLCFHSMLPGVEVSCPKTINIKQFLNTNNFSSNLHKQHNFILQKYFYKQFSCHHHIKKSFFVTNLVKINIFGFSPITRLEQDLIRCF
jgi:hypothetical protein